MGVRFLLPRRELMGVRFLLRINGCPVSSPVSLSCYFTTQAKVKLGIGNAMLSTEDIFES